MAHPGKRPASTTAHPEFLAFMPLRPPSQRPKREQISWLEKSDFRVRRNSLPVAHAREQDRARRQEKHCAAGLCEAPTISGKPGHDAVLRQGNALFGSVGNQTPDILMEKGFS